MDWKYDHKNSNDYMAIFSDNEGGRVVERVFIGKDKNRDGSVTLEGNKKLILSSKSKKDPSITMRPSKNTELICVSVRKLLLLDEHVLMVFSQVLSQSEVQS